MNINNFSNRLDSDWSELCWCKEELTETENLNTPTSSPRYFQICDIKLFLYIIKIVIVYRSNTATVETLDNEIMSTDSTRDSATSMSPPIGDDRFTPGSSAEQRHLSVDSTRDSGIGQDEPQKSSLATYLPRNIFND